MPQVSRLMPIKKPPPWHQVYASELNRCWGMRGQVKTLRDALETLDAIREKVQIAAQNGLPARNHHAPGGDTRHDPVPYEE